MMHIFHKWVYSEEREAKKGSAIKKTFSIRKCHKCGKIQKNIGYFYTDSWATGGGVSWTDQWVTIGYDSQFTSTTHEVKK